MKRSTAIVISVLAAVLVWLASNLARQSSAVVSVPVLVHSSLTGHKQVASEPVGVMAMVSASGFKLLKLQNSSRRVVDINVEPRALDLKDGDFYTLSSGELMRHVSEIFGQGVSVQNFVSQSITLRFPRENCKMVPVSPVRVLTFRAQYLPMGEVTVSPDSVLVYGEPSVVENIEQVYTSTITKNDVNRSFHGVVDLETPAGTRLSEQQVTYSMDVTRYVELRSTASVVVRGLPAGRNLALIPSTVEVVCRYVFPRSGQTNDLPELYVDYADFSKSIGGKCVVKYDALPSGAISLSVLPQVCECVETASR